MAKSHFSSSKFQVSIDCLLTAIYLSKLQSYS